MLGWLEKIFTEQCVRDKEKLKNSYMRCLQEKANIINACSSDKVYLAERIQELSDMLAAAFYIPPIDSHIQEPPPKLIQPRTVTGIKWCSDVNIADVSYYVLTSSQWINILGPIQDEVKAVLESWKPEVSDCDDFALLMNAFVAMAFEEAGLDHQGAFGIAWSKTHAYNFFIVSNGKTLVYEPQTDNVMGEIRQLSGTYDTRLIWIPG